MTNDDLDRHIRVIRSRENGWVDDPDDSGGPTHDGVTLAMWREYGWGRGKPPPRQILKDGLRVATDDDLMAFNRWYFRTQGLAELIDEFGIPDKLVPLVMDMRTLHSMEGCRKILRAPLMRSGWPDYKTLVVRESDDHEPAETYITLSRMVYMLEVAERSPKDRKYVRGWMHRALRTIGMWPPRPETREV